MRHITALALVALLIGMPAFAGRRRAVGGTGVFRSLPASAYTLVTGSVGRAIVVPAEPATMSGIDLAAHVAKVKAE